MTAPKVFETGRHVVFLALARPARSKQDVVIIKWIVAEFKTDTGIDLNGQPDALQRIKEEAEKAKIALSSSQIPRSNASQPAA